MESRVDPMSIAGKEPTAVERFPIVVVGARPAGCAAATEAAGHGFPVLLVDEHPIEPGLIGLDVPYHFGQRADGSIRNRGRMLERVVETYTNLPQSYLTTRGAGAIAPGWKHVTFAASAGRRRRSCAAGLCS
jgi:choline dehydrogenase-like flavoprotein